MKTVPSSVNIWQRKAFLEEVITEPIRAHWALLTSLVPAKVLEAYLPDHNTRPMLLAGSIQELSAVMPQISNIQVDSIGPLFMEHSNIVRILRKPYTPVFVADLLEKFERASENVAKEDVWSWYQREILTLPGLNSTLRNLLLAVALNETLFARSPMKAHITLAQYSWKEVRAKVAHGEMPDLSMGTEDKLYVKFMVAITDSAGRVLEYADYGQSQGQEKYNQQLTGEGLGNVAGEPSSSLIDPTDLKGVIQGLEDVRDSQDDPEDREAVRRLDLHLRLKRSMVDAMERDEIKNFPSIIDNADDLTPAQLSFVFKWSTLVKEMWEGNFDIEKKTGIGETGTIYPKFRGRVGLIRLDQPSTRTLIAASEALRALGMTPEVQNIFGSSIMKGEGGVSDDLTLASHDISVILARYANFEVDAARLKKEGKDVLPARISLGGNLYHPTQTLAELLLLLNHYDCDTHTIEELVEKTKSSPPTIAFLGHTKRKRADKALITFISSHLPHWKVRVIVPERAYLPDNLPSGIETVVSEKLSNTDEVSRLVADCTFLYVSNQEATSGTEGIGDGGKKPDYYVAAEVLDRNPQLHILHPLPASSEFDEKIFRHGRNLISEQMQNKIAVITTLVACQLEAIERRAAHL